MGLPVDCWRFARHNYRTWAMALSVAYAGALLWLAMQSAGLIFALMMQYTRAGWTALDYGIQASLFVLGRSVIPLLAGLLLDKGGYSVMLGCITLALAGMWLLTWRTQSIYHMQYADKIPHSRTYDVR